MGYLKGKIKYEDNSVLVRCFRESEVADVKVKKWFKDKKTIFLRNYVLRSTDTWYLFSLPVESLYKCYRLYKQQNRNEETISHKKRMDRLFNHCVHHPFPVPFELCYNVVHPPFSGLQDASWVELGSTIYFFGAHDRDVYYLEEFVVDTTASLNFKVAGCMISKRSQPKLATLDGKIYIFGNNKDAVIDNNDVCAEVFEPRPRSYEGVSKILYTPITSSNDVLFVVAIENEKKIIVGLKYKLRDRKLVKLLYSGVEATKGIAIVVYDVDSNSWVKQENNFLMNPKTLLCEPIVVDCCIYWLDTKMMWAYDLNSNRYYEGPIEDGLFRHHVDSHDINCNRVSLVHLLGDVFYLIWRNEGIHCTMIQTLKSTTSLYDNRFKLRTIVCCCQTFDSKISLNLKDGALVL